MDGKRIGFIGLGVMGTSIAAHLIAAGHSLTVFNRTREKAEGLIKRGAQWADTPGAVAAASDILISMVGYPHDVEKIYFGEGGILSAMKAGGYVVDMTTSSPKLARRLYEAASTAARSSRPSGRSRPSTRRFPAGILGRGTLLSSSWSAGIGGRSTQ